MASLSEHPPTLNDPTAGSETDPRDLMGRFISLGQNCEFGFAQRAYKAESFDLLRWASTPMPILLELLRRRFSGIGDPEKIQVRLSRSEYMVDHLGYRFTWHAFVLEGQMTPEALKQRECNRLPRMAEILIEHLTGGDKIFVLKRDDGLARDDVVPVLKEIRAYGNAPLLFVALASSPEQAGTVEALGDGLFRGYLDHFADPDHVPRSTDAPAWLKLCQAAWKTIGRP
jgi:hypothetical protein